MFFFCFFLVDIASLIFFYLLSNTVEGKAAEIRALKKQLATLQKERDQLAKENKELRGKKK